MDRRTFLQGMAGMGALIATSQLPAFAAEPCDSECAPLGDTFAKRGGFERLSLAYAVVNIGLPKPFSILHISDTHLTAVYPDEPEVKHKLQKKRKAVFGGLQEQALKDSIAWAKQHVEYLLHTGDLIDWQSQANFDLVKKYFGEQVFGCLGNHEFSPNMHYYDPVPKPTEEFKDISRETLQSIYPFNISFHSQVVNGVNFVTIDDIYGTVTQAQVEAFREEVRKGLPIVLCMHVPFHSEFTARISQRFWKDKTPGISPYGTPGGDYRRQMEDPVTSAFISYLKTEPLLKAILAGHMHVSLEDDFSPTCKQYVVAGNFLFHGREVIFM